jgi:hypothetical protein
MKSFLAILSLFGKLSLLGCFSLFGGHCGTVEAEMVSPCHMSFEERTLEKNTPEPCGQCEHSVFTWSEPIVYESSFLKEIPKSFDCVFVEKQPTELNIKAEEKTFPVKRPPDDLSTRFFKMIARSTQWRSSAA